MLVHFGPLFLKSAAHTPHNIIYSIPLSLAFNLIKKQQESHGIVEEWSKAHTIVPEHMVVLMVLLLTQHN
eukprot:9431446-Ditylum_brightwellii.AAC.1